MPVAPPSPPYLGPAPHAGSANNKPIRRIVIHCTAGAEPGVNGAARGTIAFTKRSGVVSSYHYVADAKETLQFVYDSVKAYHDGTNDHSIGYELSCSLSNEGAGHWRDADHQAMLRLVAKDVARLCLAYDVPIVKLSVSQVRAGAKGLCGHVDMRSAFPGSTTHWDPGPHFPWTDFIRMVRTEADKLTAKPDPKPEPKPDPPKPVDPPKPEAPPHDLFTVALVPGRFDAPLKDWLRRHREARDNGAQIIPMTEGTRPALVEDFTAGLGQIAGGGPLFWEVYHDPTPGPSNIIHTWDPNRFEQVGIPWKVQLDSLQIWSKTGFARPQTYAVGIALRDKQADQVILLVGAHLPLENTARRRKAKEEALAVLKEKAFDGGREQFPDGVRMFACDWNRTARKKSTRSWFAELWPGMVAGWATKRAKRQGPDWIAVGARLVHVESVVLPRVKGDPLDHTTKVSKVGWR